MVPSPKDKFMIKIIEDSFFTSAKKPEKNCQDYVLSGNDPIPYLIVTDGCSGSRYTDVGARIIAHNAKKFIEKIFNRTDLDLFENTKLTQMFYENLGNTVIFNSKKATDNIPIECLDSTLIVAFVYNDKVHVFMYGDGAIIYQSNTKGLNSIIPEFEGNAPYYLSYKCNIKAEALMERFASTFEGSKTLKYNLNCYDVDIKYSTQLFPYNNPNIFSFDVSDLSMLMITSDGILSFTDRCNNPIDLSDIIKLFTDIKSKNGEFVKRRCNKVLSNLKDQDILNYDDLAVATFLFTEFQL